MKKEIFLTSFFISFVSITLIEVILYSEYDFELTHQKLYYIEYVKFVFYSLAISIYVMLIHRYFLKKADEKKFLLSAVITIPAVSLIVSYSFFNTAPSGYYRLTGWIKLENYERLTVVADKHKNLINWSDKNHSSPLFLAAKNGNMKVISVLVDEGGKLDVISEKDRQSPNHLLRKGID